MHVEAIESGLERNACVARSLVEKYARCGNLQEARRIFDAMLPQVDVVSWASLMLGYAAKNKEEAALDLFRRLRSLGSSADTRVFLAAFKACTSLATKEEGKDFGGTVFKVSSLEKAMAAHADALENDLHLDSFVPSTLINLYAKCGSMLDARQVFDRMEQHHVVSWTALIQGYAENDEQELALELFSRMQTQGRCAANSRTFLAASNACTGLAAKEKGEEINGKVVKVVALDNGIALHSKASKAGCDGDVFLTSSLINMYTKCGSLLDARTMFDRTRSHDAVSSTAMIIGYAENGEEVLALELFEYFRSKGSNSAGIFTAALNACMSLAAKEESRLVDDRLLKVATLEKVRSIHSKARDSGRDLDTHVACTLVNLYARCGSLSEALRVFEAMRTYDVVSCNALMSGCVENGEPELALEIFSGIARPNRRSFVAALKACSRLARKEEGTLVDGKVMRVKALEKGAAIHSQAVEHGCDLDLYLASTLVDMYAKCGSLVDAHRTFSSMPRRCVVSCNSLILGYAESGEEELALELFQAMEDFPGCVPNARTFVAALNACTSLAAREVAKQVSGKAVKVEALEIGMRIHSRAAELGCELDEFVGCSLVNVYSKCGSLGDAWRVFHRMPRRDVVSWNALILGHAENEQPEMALELFSWMRDEEGSFGADPATFAALLKACGSLVALERGRSFHREICKRGFEYDAVLATCLVDFYAKCGNAATAQRVFDSLCARNTVSWSALIAAYSHQGDVNQALDHFREMEVEAVQPNAVTFVCVLTACSHGGLVEKAKDYFDGMSFKYGLRAGLEHYHCLVDLLGRANRFEEAVALIDSMPFEANAMTWKTLLGACRKWKNVDFGKLAFSSLLKLDDKDVAAFVLMANIYGSRGMVEEKLGVETMKMNAEDGKFSAGRSWWSDDTGVIHSFGAESFGKYPEIVLKLTTLLSGVEMELDHQSCLCSHSGTLAIGFGLLHSAPGTTIHIAKNLELCDGCHRVAASVAKVERRPVICRDASKLHVFNIDGICCCGD